MHEPIPTRPTSTAVPWTPDMMTPHAAPALPAPGQNVAPVQPQYQAPHPAAHPSAPLSHPHTPQAVPQQAFMPQPQSSAPHHMPSPQMTQAHMRPVQAASHALQMAQPRYAPTQSAQQFQAAPQPQHPPMPLLRAPHMPVAEQMPDVSGKPQSFIAKLLKRSPRPEHREAGISAPDKSRSLFNKSFALGAVAGLVVGALVLPIVLSLFSGDAPVQTQAQADASLGFETAPANAEGNAFGGDTFIDNAISTDAP